MYMYITDGGAVVGCFFVFLLLLWVFSKLTHTAVIVKKKKKKKMLFNNKKYKYPGTFLVVE